METWTGSIFPAFLAASILIMLIGGICVLIIIRTELAASISGLSIKQAMDSLHTAVLFFKKNGHILLQNNAMQKLMEETAGQVIFSGKHYLENTVKPRSEHMPDGKYLYHLPDSAWLFTVTEIKLGKTPVTRITAADVTEENRVNLMLHEQRKTLNARQEQLQAYIETVEEIKHSEELLNFKTKAHDTQNQKLTLLLRYLRQGEMPPGDILNAAGASLLANMQQSEEHADVFWELETLIAAYGQTGVKIILDSGLPPDNNIALALINILREAAANATLHGRADEVYVHLSANGDSVIMRISDNGANPPKTIREGSGIAEIRRLLEVFGGALVINAAEQFTLTATVPLERGVLDG
jgi:anti-sigma regulatory factor (Ser/Thr protein kinase)